MPDWLRIVMVLSIVCLISGASLAALNISTKERIEIQILKNKQMPAVEAVLAGADNNLLDDRKSIDLGLKNKTTVFQAKKGGKLNAVAIESFGKGFGGVVGVMVGYGVNDGKLTGISITTMSETPGVGTRAKEVSFTKQFIGFDKNTTLKVKSDGGNIDAVTGATVTSRAVAKAVEDGYAFFEKNKDKILQAVK